MDEGNDEELAPLVDGLSGALCILILVSVVFMLSSSDLLTASENEGLKIRESYVYLDKNMISYNTAISLSSSDLYQVRKKIIDSDKKVLILYGAVSEKIDNNEEKNTYNLLRFYSSLNLPSDIEVKFKTGNVEKCAQNLSCIYWELE